MDLSVFASGDSGSFVDIWGTDPVFGDWQHKAFVAAPLPAEMPELTVPTILATTAARAALAALDSTAAQLPNPQLLRLPTLRREAQSTSALEGTYAPLSEVLTADDEAPASAELTEILNYVRMANHAFSWVADGRPMTTGLLDDLQGILMRSTPLEAESGRIRDRQVAIGRRDDAAPTMLPVHAARFIPPPPDDNLRIGVRDLVDWIREDHSARIDPVIAAAMVHYQFEALHPFRDGNGRLGRLLIVMHLQLTGVLGEPTLTVSPWFEARRDECYNRLLAVSTRGDWDSYIRFFVLGLREAAESTRTQMIALVKIQSELKEIVRNSALRADSAHSLIDLAVANPSFTVRQVEAELGISYGRANKLVGQLTELGILRTANPAAHKRRFYAPRVLEVLTRPSADGTNYPIN